MTTNKTTVETTVETTVTSETRTYRLWWLEDDLPGYAPMWHWVMDGTWDEVTAQAKEHQVYGTKTKVTDIWTPEPVSHRA